MNMDDEKLDKKVMPKYKDPLEIVKFESNKHKIIHFYVLSSLLELHDYLSFDIDKRSTSD